jgi:hypothetical protein
LASTASPQLKRATDHYIKALHSSVETADNGINLAAHATYYLDNYEKYDEPDVAEFRKELEQWGKNAHRQATLTHFEFSNVGNLFKEVRVQGVLFIGFTD